MADYNNDGGPSRSPTQSASFHTLDGSVRSDAGTSTSGPPSPTHPSPRYSNSSLRNSSPLASSNNSDNDRISPLPSISTMPAEPAISAPPNEPVGRRSRGYSLRSQLFTRSMMQATKDTLSRTNNNNDNLTPIINTTTNNTTTNNTTGINTNNNTHTHTNPSAHFEEPAIEMTDTYNNTYYPNRPPSPDLMIHEEQPAAYHRHMHSNTSSNNDDSGLIRKKSSKSNTEAASSSTDLLPHYSSWARNTSRRGMRRVFLNSSGLRRRGVEWTTVVRDFIIRKKKMPESTGGRGIPIQMKPKNSPLLIDDRTNKPFCDNNITSSIYTPYNFLPRQLIYQFSKLANL